MAFQERSRLAMVSLGLVGDVRSHHAQPTEPLPDGIHLRWSFPPSVGFPWYGYYLFRRKHPPPQWKCTSQHVAKNPPKPSDSQLIIEVGAKSEGGRFSSDNTLRLSELFGPNDSPEMDLSQCGYLRFDLPTGVPACQIAVEVGFHQESLEPLTMEVWSGGVLIRQLTVEGTPGGVTRKTVVEGVIDAVVLHGTAASLVELCYEPLRVGDGWQMVPGLEAPLTLPVFHPNYPATGSEEINLDSARVDARRRILWGDQGFCDAPEFDELHEHLLGLVQGGIDGPQMTSVAMDLKAIADDSEANSAAPELVPGIEGFRILDWAMLCDLNPAFAQMMGVYFWDGDVAEGESYDYIILADHRGDLAVPPDAEKALRRLNAGAVDYHVVDGWICWGVSPRPGRLQAPSKPDVYVQPPLADHTAGLHCTIPLLEDPEQLSSLKPESPVWHYLWRADVASDRAVEPAQHSEPDKESYRLVSLTPFAIGKPEPAEILEAEDSPHRPPVEIHCTDSGLAEGWYAYRVSGVDIFGRHSELSPAAIWRQWDLAPKYQPWYFQDPPPADGVRHPFAVAFFDKTPPPAPWPITAVALDPDDVQRDERYRAWRKAHEDAGTGRVVGVRVTFYWPKRLQEQAPDAREFRIYFKPGRFDRAAPDESANPGKQPWHDPGAWHRRIHVLRIDSHVVPPAKLGHPDDLYYDVLWPFPGDPGSADILAIPEVDQVTLYGEIGVSTADPKGNEGSIGGPALFRRVRQERPQAPETVPSDSERVYATPADWHSRSYYTFRWRPKPGLFTHVFRASDESIFTADWASRPRRPLSADDLPWFPEEWRSDAEAPRRQHIAAALNKLNNFANTEAARAQAMTHYRGLTNDALRVLAGLPETTRAFVQRTISPLDPDDPGNADRRGPDSPDGYEPQHELRAYVDELDGRSSNKFFYRSTVVDRAHNKSPLGLSGPPVLLPNVVPPRAPVVTAVAAGDPDPHEPQDGKISLRWAASSEVDVIGYRVYRTDSEENARDVRLMDCPIGKLVIDRIYTDRSVQAGVTYYYRVTAMDNVGNESRSRHDFAARAFDLSAPDPPAWQPTTRDAATGDVVLSWTSSDVNLRFLVQRSADADNGWQSLGSWLPPGTHHFLDRTREPEVVYQYRLKVIDQWGRMNRLYHLTTF